MSLNISKSVDSLRSPPNELVDHLRALASVIDKHRVFDLPEAAKPLNEEEKEDPHMDQNERDRAGMRCR